MQYHVQPDKHNGKLENAQKKKGRKQNMKRDIVILTRSYKRGGLCVAGIDAKTGEWVRLVSSDVKSHGALTSRTASSFNVLDQVQVEIEEARPTPYQPENLLVDIKQRIIKTGTWNLEQVLNLHPAEDPDYIFVNTNRALSEKQMSETDGSLVLVHVDNFSITDIQRRHASFLYRGNSYYLSVTDPTYRGTSEETSLDSAYLVVSLPDEPYEENDPYYKFVAKVFPG